MSRCEPSGTTLTPEDEYEIDPPPLTHQALSLHQSVDYSAFARRKDSVQKDRKRRKGKNGISLLSTGVSGNEINYGGFEDEALYSWRRDAKDMDEDNTKVLSPVDNVAPKRRKNQKAGDIPCDINDGKYLLTCKREGKEVFIPFSFLSKYYEVVGRIDNGSESGNKHERFVWQHSLPKIYHPKSQYDSKAGFSFFDSYNVEVRDRVKCVNGAEGIKTVKIATNYLMP